MGNEIIIPDVESSLSTDQKAFDKVSTQGDYLGRLQLVAKNASMLDTEPPGADFGGQWLYIKYGVSGNERLTADKKGSFDVAPIKWRTKSLIMLNNRPEATFYDPDSDGFQECVAKADVKNSPDGRSWMYGPSFLLWVPKAAGGKGAFAELFCSGKTSRKRAKGLRDMGTNDATLSSEFLNPPTSPYSWWAPVFKPCTVKLTVIPDPDVLKKELTRFLNPIDGKAEVAPDDGGREV